MKISDLGGSGYIIAYEMWKRTEIIEFKGNLSESLTSMLRLLEIDQFTVHDNGNVSFVEPDTYWFHATSDVFTEILTDMYKRLKLNKPNPLTGKSTDWYFIGIVNSVINSIEGSKADNLLSCLTAIHGTLCDHTPDHIDLSHERFITECEIHDWEFDERGSENNNYRKN